jgi:hypothetical protein
MAELDDDVLALHPQGRELPLDHPAANVTRGRGDHRRVDERGDRQRVDQRR